RAGRPGRPAHPHKSGGAPAWRLGWLARGRELEARAAGRGKDEPRALAAHAALVAHRGEHALLDLALGTEAHALGGDEAPEARRRTFTAPVAVQHVAAGESRDPALAHELDPRCRAAVDRRIDDADP